jgi:hypothetical protein
MLRHNLLHLRVAATTAVAALSLAGSARAGDFVYRPGTSDPTVGMNIWKVTTTENVPLVEQQVQQMYASGLRQVTIIPITYVNPTTGAFSSTNADGTRGGLTNAELTASIAKARSLGMSVTVNPMVQRTDDGSRSLLYFDPLVTTPGSSTETFWSGYNSTLTNWATIAKNAGAQRFNVGSELEALEGSNPNIPVTNPSATLTGLRDRWSTTINVADAALGGTAATTKLGYHSNHWSFSNAKTKFTIWDNAKIDYVALSAYYDYDPPFSQPGFTYPGRTGLATPTQSATIQSASDPAFVSLVEANFKAWIDNVVLGVSTKPIVIQEFGIAPYNQAASEPWEFNWNGRNQWLDGTPRTAGSPWPYDAFEARDAIEAVLRSLDGKSARIEEINFWLWQWSGGFKGEPFGIKPGYTLTDDPTTTLFDETKNQLGSDALFSYLQTVPEPSVMVATVLVLGGALQRRRFV